jgi:hypothetical protein
VSTGTAAVLLDGASLDSNLIHLDASIAGEHELHVRLGNDRIATRDRQLGE